MFYNEDRNLEFEVFTKLNSKVAYVNLSSDYIRTVIKEIPNGVLERLTKLTALLDEKKKMKLNELYLMYRNKLKEDRLIMGEVPTFRSVERKIKSLDIVARKKERKYKDKDKCNIYFCIVYSRR